MTLTRRQWLRTVVLGAGALAAGSVAGCAGPVREDFDESSPRGARGPDLDPAIRELLRWAALAPSSRNTQPWTVRMAGDASAVVGLDPNRRLRIVDPDDGEALIGLGAFAENFVLAAGVRGLATDVRVLPDAPARRDVLELAWRSARTVDYPLERLARRRTVRSGYSSRPLAPRHRDLLLAALAGHARVVEPHAPEGAWMREHVVEASRRQTARREAQLEASQWLRWRDEDARRHRDGLTPEGMEIEGLDNWWARNTYSRATALTPDYARRTVESVRRRSGRCGAWIVVTREGDDDAARIEAGRRFERMALLLGDLRLAAHPMTQLLEEPELRDAMVATLQLAEPPALLLRVGYVTRQDAAVSLRRPVGWFVTA